MMRKKINLLIIFLICINLLTSGFLFKKKKIEPVEIELKKEDIYTEPAIKPTETPIPEKTDVKKEDYTLGNEGLPILVVNNFKADKIDPAVINIISDKLQFDILKNGKFRIIDRINLPKLFEKQNIKTQKEFEPLKSYCEKLKKINIDYLISGNLNNYNETYSLDLLQVNVSNCEVEQIANVIAKENPSNLINEIDNVAIKFEPKTKEKIEEIVKEKPKEIEKSIPEVKLPSKPKETPASSKTPVEVVVKPTPEAIPSPTIPTKPAIELEAKPAPESTPLELVQAKPAIEPSPMPISPVSPIETAQPTPEAKELKTVEPKIAKSAEQDLSSINSQLSELSKKIETIEKKLDENIKLSTNLDQAIKKNQEEIEKLKLKMTESSQESVAVLEGIPAEQLYQDALKFPEGSKDRSNKLLQAIKQDPNNVIYRQKLAKTYYSLKDYDNAIKQCDAAIKINNNDPYNYTLKGTTLFEKGEYKDAAILHEKAILLDPTYSSAYYNLALTYEKIDRNLAIKKWEEYLNISNDDPTQQDWIPIAKKRMEKLKIDTEMPK